ncbi:MAG: translocation/assembly module TamB domain-containing protein [Deltaproteobacteria bacterium]|nr:translocation/assembly module TamB domain-containing protein [Deltaproteobacteria bacterium]
MRRILTIGLAVIVILGLAGWVVLQSQSFWRWGGWEVVNLAQDRLNGELRVDAVQGQPFTGFTFTNVTLTGSQGEILHTDKVELRFSLWSFLRLQPVIATLSLHEPRLTLRQDQESRWEVATLLKKRPPPPFQSLDFRQILVQHGQAVLVRPEGNQVFEDLNLDLDFILLHPKRPNQEIRVRRASLAATTPMGRFGFKSSFTYAQNRLTIDSLDLESGTQVLSSLRGQGLLGPEEARLNFEVGPIPGELLHRLWLKWPEHWEVNGKFHLAILDQTHYEITGTGSLQQAVFDLQGAVSQENGRLTYDLTAKLGGLRAELLEPFQPQWAQKLKGLSPVAAGLALKGTGVSWPPEQLDWSLDCATFRDHGISVEQLKINVAGNAREQNLQGLARGNFGEISLAAAGPLFSNQKADLKIQTKDFRPARLGLNQAGETILNGKFTGACSWPDYRALAGLKVAGDLEARGRLGEEPLEDFRAKLSWQQPKLDIPQASLRLGPLAASFSGSLDDNRLNWQFKGSLAPGVTRPYLPVATPSRLELNGALTGTLQAPRFSGQGNGAGLTAAGLSLKSFTFKANAAGWPPATGDLEIRGAGLSTPAGVFSQTDLSCRGEANLWQLHFAARTPEGPQAEVSGTADLRTRPISLTLQKVSWHTKEIAIANSGPVQLRLLPGLQLATATFKANGGVLALNLEAQGSRLTGSLNLQNFPARLLSLKGASLQGSIDGQVSLAGEPGAPLLQGKVKWAPGQVGEFPFQALQATFSYRPGSLQLTGSLDEKVSGARLVCDGQIPLNLSLIPLNWSLGNQNLALTVRGEKTSLAMLTASPQVQAAEGALDLMVQLRGNPQHPQVSGHLRWGEGSLKLRVAGLPYRLLPGEALLQGDKITIRDLTLESGGTLHLSGDFNLKGFTPGQLALRGQAANFLALRREGTQAEANGTISLTGPWDHARFTGQILVPKATFATSFFSAGPHPDIILVNKPAEPAAKSAPSNLVFWQNLQIDLTLQSAGEVWVKNKDLKVEMQGSLKVIKAPGRDKVAVAGVMQAVKGTIELQGRTFKVAEGSVTLPGKPGVPGTLAGRAINEMEGITMFMDISGPTNKPVVRLSSNPPLPSPDLLSYLVFGRPAATLNKEQYAAVGQQAVGILGGLSAKKFQDFLGTDFPLLGNVTMRGGEQTVGVTKPLTKELSVSFERRTNPLYRENNDQVRVEYKVNKYMSLESTAGRRNTGGDVIFNYDF